MSRRKRKLAAKYVVRRAVFALLLLGVIALGVWGLWKLLSRSPDDEGKGSSPPSSPSSTSQSQPEPGSGSTPDSRPESGPDAPESPSGSSSSSAPPPSSASIVPADTDGDWKLILINPTHAIESELDIELATVNGYKFDSRIVQNVKDLIAAAKEDGISLSIISGYRTLERSRTLYQNKVAEYKAAGYDDAAAKKEAAKWVAPPGTSEHHTGLAMDIVSSDYYQNYNDLVEAFAQDPEAIWLKENCARFGFILRFPKDKVDITGINFEPWHFRYVGEEAAKDIMDRGICLEEYLAE